MGRRNEVEVSELRESESSGRRVAGPLFGAVAATAAAAYGLSRLLARGKLAVDLGLGRSVRPLGPLSVRIAAPRETVFDVVAEPYLDRTPRALEAKLKVIERSSEMVLAAHFTPVGRFVATTVETVRFERPSTVHFRLVHGPVPHVVEQFVFEDADGETTLEYRGEIGADLWRLGRWWSGVVAERWEAAVASSLEQIRAEAERRDDRSTG